MSSALLVRGASAFAGDLALLVGVHRGKTAVAPARTFRVVRHPADLQRYWETKCGTVYIRFEYSKRSHMISDFRSVRMSGEQKVLQGAGRFELLIARKQILAKKTHQFGRSVRRAAECIPMYVAA